MDCSLCLVEPQELEEAIRRHADAGRMEQAATLALEGYGAEVLGFLHAILNAPSEAEEAFSAVCERMWKGLPKFLWRSSFRTWLYAIARNVASRHSMVRGRERERVVPLSATSAIGRIAARIKSSTANHLRAESKERLHRVRQALDPDERMLLVLRIDRELPWGEIAVVLGGEELSPEELSKEAAKLRQRFARLKAKVTAMYRAL